MELRHKDLTVRNAGEEDAAQLAAWWNDGRVMAHAGFPLGLDTTAEKIAGQLRTDDDGVRRRLILEKAGVRIGEMSYRILADGAAEIGVKICESAYQNRGVGRVALSMLIAALFDRGCPRIVLDTNPVNLRARHVYELLGFRETGVRIDCWQDQLGRPQSAVDYELTREDFIAYE